MTRVSIAPSDIEEDITAEQVAAYLLSPKRGWVEWSTVNATRAFRWEGTNPILVIVPREVDSQVIRGIARAEGRHPSAVLADIAGPAVGSGIPSRGETAECGPGPGAPIYATDIERAKCMFRARLTLQRIERERREASRVYVGTADEECAREAQKESE